MIAVITALPTTPGLVGHRVESNPLQTVEAGVPLHLRRRPYTNHLTLIKISARIGAMKDPHTHVEKDITFGHALVRSVIAAATGLAPSAPKTVATGCSRRRPYAMTSTKPDMVTCLACREWARQQHTMTADTAEAALKLLTDTSLPDEKRTQVASSVEHHRMLAAAYSTAPS